MNSQEITQFNWTHFFLGLVICKQLQTTFVNCSHCNELFNDFIFTMSQYSLVISPLKHQIKLNSMFYFLLIWKPNMWSVQKLLHLLINNAIQFIWLLMLLLLVLLLLLLVIFELIFSDCWISNKFHFCTQHCIHNTNNIRISYSGSIEPRWDEEHQLQCAKKRKNSLVICYSKTRS